MAIGGFLIYQQRNIKTLKQNTEILRRKIEISKNNIYRDEDNGFEFIIPFNTEINLGSFHDESMSYAGNMKIGNFKVFVEDKQEYVTAGGANGALEHYYKKEDNSWYKDYILIEENFDGKGNYKETIESTDKVCDNKIIINSQPFYFAQLGEEGFISYGYFALLNNDKLVTFIASGEGRFDPTKRAKQGQGEILEVLKSFKTLGEVKLINTADCK